MRRLSVQELANEINLKRLEIQMAEKQMHGNDEVITQGILAAGKRVEILSQLEHKRKEYIQLMNQLNVAQFEQMRMGAN